MDDKFLFRLIGILKRKVDNLVLISEEEKIDDLKVTKLTLAAALSEVCNAISEASNSNDNDSNGYH